MRVRLALVPVLVLALLGGCAGRIDRSVKAADGNGVAAMSAEQILAEAEAALAATTSFRLRSTGGGITSNLVFEGADYQGTVDFPGATMQVIKVGTDFYMKDNGEMLATLSSIPMSPRMSSRLASAQGKYLKTDLNNPMFPANSAAIYPDDILGAARSYSKGAVRTIDGARVITLSGGDGVLYIATRGKPYPLRFDVGDGKSENAQFSDFDAPPTIKAPPAADVVDLISLLQS